MCIVAESDAKYEVELKAMSATSLKNVNWKNGPLCPYIVASLDSDPITKSKTSVPPLADSGPDGTDPVWDAEGDDRAKVVLKIRGKAGLYEVTLLVEVLHAKDDARDVEKVKPLVGSARIDLRDILQEVCIGESTVRAIRLTRPSGRPQGVVKLKICVRELQQPYQWSSGKANYGGGYRMVPPPHVASYKPLAGGYGYCAPPVGSITHPVAEPARYPYYGGAPSVDVTPPGEAKTSEFSVGTCIAIGAAAGLLGGFAIAEGIDHIKDEIAEDAAEKVENDLAADE